MNYELLSYLTKRQLRLQPVASVWTETQKNFVWWQIFSSIHPSIPPSLVYVSVIKQLLAWERKWCKINPEVGPWYGNDMRTAINSCDTHSHPHTADCMYFIHPLVIFEILCSPPPPFFSEKLYTIVFCIDVVIALHLSIPLFFHNAFISSVSQRITFTPSLHQLKQWVIRNLQTRWLTICVWWQSVSTVCSYVIVPTYILHIWSRGPCVPWTRSLLLCRDIISAQLFFYVGELEHGSWVFQQSKHKNHQSSPISEKV